MSLYSPFRLQWFRDKIFQESNLHQKDYYRSKYFLSKEVNGALWLHTGKRLPLWKQSRLFCEPISKEVV